MADYAAEIKRLVKTARLPHRAAGEGRPWDLHTATGNLKQAGLPKASNHTSAMCVAGGWRMRGLAADPHLAAFKVFLLPDRHHFLQTVDRKTASFEGLRPMRRGNRSEERRV